MSSGQSFLASLFPAVFRIWNALPARSLPPSVTAAGFVRLSTIGVLATWLLGAFAAQRLLQLELRLALVLGALFVVTGPTVVGPMLRHIRPRGSVGNILKWEGIVTDPIGAVLAVLLFETLVLSAAPHATPVSRAGSPRP